MASRPYRTVVLCSTNITRQNTESLYMTKEQLIQFEQEIAELFKQGKIRCPIHLSSGNEDKLIEIFKHIWPGDYVFSTHRNHLHYLLLTGDTQGLKDKILAGDSMHTCSPKHNFYTSSIVAGCVAIACGVAYGIKLKGDKRHVWCFLGDAATDEGWTNEALKYAAGKDLPITYVLEDNNRSVCTTIQQRWGTDGKGIGELSKLMVYQYTCGYPHAGVGTFIDLDSMWKDDK